MPAKPRVYLVAHEVHDRGGMEHVTAQLIRYGHRDIDFIVLSRELASDLQPLVDWWPINTPAAPFPLKFVTFALAAGWKLRGRHDGIVHTLGAVVPNRVDLVTVHMAHAALVRHLGRLTTSGGGLPRRLNAAISRLLALGAERWSYRPTRTRRLAGVSRGVADECLAQYGHPDVVVTPNGVDVERFAQNESVRREMRVNVPVGSVVSVFVGGEWGRKGLDLVLRAIVDVPEIQLWVVGDGAGETVAMKRLAESLGVAGRVNFVGAQADTARFYSGADVFVLPSSYETFSLAAHEAAAASLPLVASRVHGVDELVDLHGGGLLVDRNPKAIKDALTHLIINPLIRTAMGESARSAVESRTWEISARSTVTQYLDLGASPRGQAAGPAPS